MQAADTEGRAVESEAIDNNSKITSNKVQEYDSSSRSNQITFNSSLYTQELSTENQNKKCLTESAPENKEPSNNNEETQFSIMEKQDETIINCSQDLFSSQTANSEQNTSKINKAATDIGIGTAVSLHTSHTPSGANSRKMNANHEGSNTTEVMADSCMATVRENNESEQTQTLGSIKRILDVPAEKNKAKGAAANDKDDDKMVTEGEGVSSTTVLQPDIQNPSTSNAPTGPHLNCSGSIPLVPDFQNSNLLTKANGNCDAVVPQLDDDDFDDNSYDSPDFEPEE